MCVHRNPKSPICFADQISQKILAITLITVVIFGCKNKSGLVVTSDPPQVSLISPAAEEENVALTSTISVTFNRQMDPSSINDTTFIVLRDTVAVAGGFSYRDSTSTFTPTANLAANSTIHVRISANVWDMNGNTMDQDFEWSFTTEDETQTEPEPETDNTPPQITETNPLQDAQNIPMNSAITATFSEEIDPSTVNTATFLLEDGNTVINGSVSYSGMTAVFTPSESLEMGTVYLATVTNGVQDTAGNPLTEDYTWNFNTENTEEEETDTVPPTISATNPDDTNDNVAVDVTLSATFSEPMNASTISETSFTLSDGENSVNGVVEYSGNSATFNPDGNLVNGSTYTATITTGVQDTAGNSMAENYSWSFTTEEAEETDTTPPTVNATDPEDNEVNMPVNSEISATFSEPVNASTITANTFTLSLDGDPVPGSVTSSGNSATFNPDEELENGTIYTATITTGVQDTAGNSMTENYTWNFTTEEAEETDIEAPEISSTSPADNDDNVAVDVTLSATFSEPMNASSISETTFTLSDGENSVNGIVEYFENNATFDPDGDLENGTTYTATITTGAEDLAGNPLSVNYQWSFTTEEAEPEGDVTPPQVTGTTPDNDDNNVGTDIEITANFSESLDPASVNDNTFVVQRQILLLQIRISGTVSYSGTTATFTPDENLINDSDYTVTLTTGITDLAGNDLPNDYEWSFETANNNNNSGGNGNDDDDDDDD